MTKPGLAFSLLHHRCAYPNPHFPCPPKRKLDLAQGIFLNPRNKIFAPMNGGKVQPRWSRFMDGTHLLLGQGIFCQLLLSPSVLSCSDLSFYWKTSPNPSSTEWGSFPALVFSSMVLCSWESPTLVWEPIIYRALPFRFCLCAERKRWRISTKGLKVHDFTTCYIVTATLTWKNFINNWDKSGL